MEYPRPPRLQERADVITAVGGPAIFEDLCRNYSLRPAHRAKGFRFYDLAEVEATCEQRQREQPR